MSLVLPTAKEQFESCDSRLISEIDNYLKINSFYVDRDRILIPATPKLCEILIGVKCKTPINDNLVRKLIESLMAYANKLSDDNFKYELAYQLLKRDDEDKARNYFVFSAERTIPHNVRNQLDNL